MLQMFPGHMKCLVVVALVAVSGCDTLTETRKLETSAQNADKAVPKLATLNDVVTPYRTAGLEIVEAGYGPDTYYSQLFITGKNIPSSIGTCSTYTDELLEKFKRLIGIKDANTVSILADITMRGKVLFKNLPLLVVSKEDKGGDGGIRCITYFNNGAITPKFRVSGDLSIRVSMRLAYAKNMNIEVVEKLVGFAKGVTGLFGLQGAVVTSLVGDKAEKLTQRMDKSISDLFTTQAADYFNADFQATAALGKVRQDGVKIDIGRVLADTNNAVTTATALSVEMMYHPSVVGAFHGNKLRYPGTADGVLATKALVYQGGKAVTKTVGAAIRDGLVPGADDDLLGVLDGKSDGMGKACTAIKTFLVEDLDLTANDRLAIRWAIIKAYTKYDMDTDLRTPKCFTDSTASGTNEIQSLLQINDSYVFNKKISDADMTKMLKRYLAATTIDNYLQLYDKEEFSFLVSNDPESDLVPPRIPRASWGGFGAEAIERVRQLFKGSYMCHTLPTGKRGRFSTHLAMMARLRGGLPSKHPGFMDAKNEPLAPVIVEFSHDLKKIVFIGVLSIDVIHSAYGIPTYWPTGQHNGTCNVKRA